ncbi:potassium channel family protein [Acidobacteriota bacterium]
MTELFQRLSRFWQTDRGLTAFTVALIIVGFGTHPLQRLGFGGKVLLSVFLSLLVISGIVAVARRSSTTIIVAVLAVVTVVLEWLNFASASRPVEMVSLLSKALVFSVLTVIVLWQVFREGPITLHRIIGAVAVYTLTGIVFGQIYTFLEVASPGAFHDAQTGVIVSGELLYFRFVTLTTVGYGEITPVLPFARSLALLEGLVGQLFPAILIARLVAMELASSRKA